MNDATSEEPARSYASAPSLLGFLGTFIISVGVLMVINTRLLGLGDPKWGPGGWRYYWLFWALLYSPVACLASARCLRVPRRAARLASLGGLLALLLLSVQVSFRLNLDWAMVIAELAVILAIAEVIARLVRSAA